MAKTNGKSASRNIDVEKYPIELFHDWVAMVFEDSDTKSSIILPEITKEKRQVAKCVALGPDADISMLGKCVFFDYSVAFTEVSYNKQKYALVSNERMQGAFIDR